MGACVFFLHERTVQHSGASVFLNLGYTSQGQASDACQEDVPGTSVLGDSAAMSCVLAWAPGGGECHFRFADNSGGAFLFGGGGAPSASH